MMLGFKLFYSHEERLISERRGVGDLLLGGGRLGEVSELKRTLC